jgi:quercetin dioxygenase-like cupin family protein
MFESRLTARLLAGPPGAMTKFPTKTQSAEAGSTYPTHRACAGPLTNGTARSTAPTSQAGTIIREKGEGERLWFAGGGVHIWKATAAETNGAFILVEDRMTQGKTTPLHTHPNVDETLIVLEGEILVYAEEREHRVGPHGVAVATRGDAHAFMVTSESALILTLQTPGSGEAFYRDVSKPSTHDTDAERPPDLVRLRAAAQRHPEIIEILGPPPFEAAREESAARAKA